MIHPNRVYVIVQYFLSPTMQGEHIDISTVLLYQIRALIYDVTIILYGSEETWRLIELLQEFYTVMTSYL